MWDRLRLFLNPFDGRYEDLRKGHWPLIVFRDFTAGLIVAMVAIPLAMGFAIASGLKPEHGIVGGAVAGLIGALFGGSKYQVYGPTAAFIPIIAEIMHHYGKGGQAYDDGYQCLVLVSIIAGVILMGMGLLGLGRFVSKVPHSIVVGFTIGIAITIALSQVGEVLGLKAKLGYDFLEKLRGIAAHVHEFNLYALLLAAGTFALTKVILKVSVYIPGPLLAIGLGTLISSTVWADRGLTLVVDKYGRIPTNLLRFTPSSLEMFADHGARELAYLLYFVAAVVFVAAIESLLCSRMADRLAGNKGLPYNPNKELWGQGLVNIIAPLLNGFPHTGALARTATNIKVGAVTPLAGIFKCVLKLALAAFLAAYLERVPMACIGGILLFVASNMVKRSEVKEVLEHNWFHIALMVWTAALVVLTDFLMGVLSGIVLYALFYRFFDRKPTQEPAKAVDAQALEDQPHVHTDAALASSETP